MSEIDDQAAKAQALQENGAFIGLLNQIEADAIGVFVNGSAAPDMLSAAHDKIKAIAVIRTALQKQIDNKRFADKTKEQHRGND